METTEQKLLVKKLDESKSLLLSSINRGEVIELIKEIIRIVSPVLPASDERMNNAHYKEVAKSHALDLLGLDLKGMKDGSYYDWERIHCQVSISILLLEMIFTDGGQERIQEIVDEEL